MQDYRLTIYEGIRSTITEWKLFAQEMEFEAYSIDFLISKKQKLEFKLTNKVEEHVAVAICYFGEIIGSNESSSSLSLISQGKEVGSLNVQAYSKSKTEPIAILDVTSALGDKKEYYYCWYKNPESKPAFRSASSVGETCLFNTIKIHLDDLCFPEEDKKEIKVEFYSRDELDKEDYAGEINNTLSKVVSTDAAIIQDKKKAHVGFSNIKYSIKEHRKLELLLLKGLQIEISIGIDFNKTNLPISNPESFHCIDSIKSNYYESALEEFISTLSFYSKNEAYAAYGFGAKMKNTTVNHCLPINLNLNEPEIVGAINIKDSYRKFLTLIELDEPRFLAPFIKNAYERITQDLSSPFKYTIALVLTNGEIKDKTKVKELLISQSLLPLSIIAIGIGEGPFNTLMDLESKCSLLSNGKCKAKRNIFKFFKYSSVKYNPEDLLDQALQDIPSQIEEYFMLKS